MTRIKNLFLVVTLAGMASCGGNTFDLRFHVDQHCRDLGSHYKYDLEALLDTNRGQLANDTVLYDKLHFNEMTNTGNFSELGFCCMCRDDAYQDQVNKYMSEFSHLYLDVKYILADKPVHISESQREDIRKKLVRMIAIVDAVNKIPLRK